eukprot:1461641-Amphidinium_carterae.2
MQYIVPGHRNNKKAIKNKKNERNREHHQRLYKAAATAEELQRYGKTPYHYVFRMARRAKPNIETLCGQRRELTKWGRLTNKIGLVENHQDYLAAHADEDSDAKLQVLFMYYDNQDQTNHTSKPAATMTGLDVKQRENQQSEWYYNLQSSAEAELYAIGKTVNDVIYMRNFLHELNFTSDNRLIPHIYTDSSSAKCLTQQLGLTKRTKHIDIRYLHVQQLQSDGELRIHKVSTENNPSG